MFYPGGYTGFRVSSNGIMVYLWYPVFVIRNMLLYSPDSDYINVCYGGNFLVQRRGTLSQSLDAWTNMELSLSRGDNILEKDILLNELGPPPSDVSWAVLSRELQPFVTKLANSKIADYGRISISKDSPFWVVS
jgi:hypothetical protein